MLLSSYNNNILLIYYRHDLKSELTHEVYNQLLGLEVLLHLHPYAIQLEFL